MKNKVTAKRLRDAMDACSIKAQELSERSGVAKASISQYINGSHKPSNISAGKIAEILDVDPLWLMGFDVPMKKTSAPVYEAAAGEGLYGDGAPVDEYALKLDSDQRLVRVKGDSMEPTFVSGDLVVVSAQSVIDHPRQIALVKINGDEATLKRVEIKDDGILLIGDNVNEYAPHFYTKDEVVNLPVTIEGVVMKLIREID